jgi:hypothetical protein
MKRAVAAAAAAAADAGAGLPTLPRLEITIVTLF